MNDVLLYLKKCESKVHKRMMRYCFDKATKALRRHNMASFTWWNDRGIDHSRKYVITNLEYSTALKGS